MRLHPAHYVVARLDLIVVELCACVWLLRVTPTVSQATMVSDATRSPCALAKNESNLILEDQDP